MESWEKVSNSGSIDPSAVDIILAVLLQSWTKKLQHFQGFKCPYISYIFKVSLCFPIKFVNAL